MDKLREYLNLLKERFNALTPVQKALAVGIPLLLLSLGAVALIYLSQENYTVLYTGLSPDDLNAVVTELDKEGVKYKISPDGRTIYVPENVARELRLKLAAKGVPRKGIVGYELFDKSGIVLSRFQQLVNFKRAIEGELAKTIMSLDCVEFARVHIVLPEKSLFIREEEEAKASVFLKLKPGCELTPEQVKAIRNLVSGSVENLKPSQVVVVDDKGRDLTAYLDEEFKTNASQLKVKREFEKSLERKLQKTLEEVFDYGKVKVNVSAELDFSSMKKREELYDPDLTAVVSEQKKKERTTSTRAQGIPGTQANIPPATGRQGGGELITERKESITNYEVSKREIYFEDKTIKVKRISVGLVIDKDVKVNTEELKNLIIASAGLDPKRGDQVSIVSVPFVKPTVVAEKPKVPTYVYVAVALVSLVILGLVAFGLVKLLRRRPPAPTPAPAVPGVPPTVEEVRKKTPYEELLEIAKQEPEKVAMVLKKWLKEG